MSSAVTDVYTKIERTKDDIKVATILQQRKKV